MNHTNSVELIGYYGSDEAHACSAWTSTSREITEDKKKRIPALLSMLASNGHHTPFEKSSLHFLVKTDIASHIHLLKHRVGVSINAESARYKELKEDNYYTPIDWPYEWVDELHNYTKQGLKLYHKCIDSLTSNYGINRKRAKESARFFRPYNAQIVADVMFNFRSFAHFQGLRNKPDAQLEIKDIAQKMLTEVANIDGKPFRHTLEAFKLIY
jgi:flavin-dependent thymidylate synthase